MADLLLTQDLRRITVTLAADERDALRALAFQERRDTRQQAALIIRCELERRGLLPISGDYRPPEVRDVPVH
jgi:hypothetical protein